LPTRHQRDVVDAVNGDTWYKNYQIKECQGSNKSSFCNGFHSKQQQQRNNGETKHVPEISELFDELDEKDKPTTTWRTSNVEKLHDDVAGSAGVRRINDKNMKVDHLPLPLSDVSDQHKLLPISTNYDPNQLNIEARLNAKTFLAKQQNTIREIEMKHQHLSDNDDDAKKLSENQLHHDSSSNSNFPFTFNLNTSPVEDVKRSSGQRQKSPTPQHFDDQLSQKKNDLFDELDQKLSKSEQEGSQTLHRVKRRDIDSNVINRLMSEGKFNIEEFMKSHSGEPTN
jgi:hypothetical protein